MLPSTLKHINISDAVFEAPHLQMGLVEALLNIHAAVHNAVIIQHLLACCPLLQVGLQCINTIFNTLLSGLI